MGRLNRPGLMVYGGTIRPGSCEGAPQLDIISAFQAYGKYLQDGKTDSAERERVNVIRNACPGPGTCGGVSICASFRVFRAAESCEVDVHRKHHGQRRGGVGQMAAVRRLKCPREAVAACPINVRPHGPLKVLYVEIRVSPK